MDLVRAAFSFLPRKIVDSAEIRARLVRTSEDDRFHCIRHAHGKATPQHRPPLTGPVTYLSHMPQCSLIPVRRTSESSRMPSPFVIMTGASGVGKTTIARTVRVQRPDISVFLEEELEPPTEAFMQSIGPTDGPGGPFQRGFALYSIPQLARVRNAGRPVLLDCQCRIAFLQEALTATPVSGVTLTLVECDDPTRDARLHGRGSPELAHEQMRNWSRFLHAEAVTAGLDILDTGHQSLSENVRSILRYF